MGKGQKDCVEINKISLMLRMGTHQFVCTNSMVFTALFVLGCLIVQVWYDNWKE